MHNADLLPPQFDAPVAITWRRTDKPLTRPSRLVPRGPELQAAAPGAVGADRAAAAPAACAIRRPTLVRRAPPGGRLAQPRGEPRRGRARAAFAPRLDLRARRVLRPAAAFRALRARDGPHPAAPPRRRGQRLDPPQPGRHAVAAALGPRRGVLVRAVLQAGRSIAGAAGGRRMDARARRGRDLSTRGATTCRISCTPRASSSSAPIRRSRSCASSSRASIRRRASATRFGRSTSDAARSPCTRCSPTCRPRRSRRLERHLQTRRFDAGDIILRAGVASAELFGLIEGAVRVELADGGRRVQLVRAAVLRRAVGADRRSGLGHRRRPARCRRPGSSRPRSSSRRWRRRPPSSATSRPCSGMRLRERTRRAPASRPRVVLMPIGEEGDRLLLAALGRGLQHYAPGSEHDDGAARRRGNAAPQRMRRWRDEGHGDAVLLLGAGLAGCAALLAELDADDVLLVTADDLRRPRRTRSPQPVVWRRGAALGGGGPAALVPRAAAATRSKPQHRATTGRGSASRRSTTSCGGSAAATSAWP